MICPNCKTELVQVNGRYICSDCGREIPENEVMASDWGNGGTARAGLYGAGTDDVPEEGSSPITDYDASLTESENEVQTETKDADELSVEEILQEQVTQPEPAAEVAAPDTGFYAPEATEQSTANNQQPTEVEPAAVTPPTPVSSPASQIESNQLIGDLPGVDEGDPRVRKDDNLGVVEPVIAPAPTIPEAHEITMAEPEIPVVTPVMPVSEPVIPVVPLEMPEVPVVPAPEIQEIPVVVPEAPQPEVVKDMFEEVTPAAPLAHDPGIYKDPMYEGSDVSQPQAPASTALPMATDKKVNLIILISGIVLVVLLIAGGTWGYLALNAKSEPVAPTPVVVETVWQELQSVDGGFKMNFPGKPETLEEMRPINGVESAVTAYTYSTDDILYSASFSQLDEAQSKNIVGSLQTTLPLLTEEVAKSFDVTVTSSKIGKYYAADAIDFALSSETANYQGKIILNGSKYILVMAGSPSGQTVEYSKFMKSFAFVTSGNTP